MKTEELLAVLDMTEDQQITWFYQRPEPELHSIVWVSPKAKFKDGMLADLAFRMRDEMWESSTFYSPMLDVQNKVQKDCSRAIDYKFWAIKARPIHWIIAALIAKELSIEPHNT